MKESDSDIRSVLDACGEDMEFDAGTLKGIPGQNVYNIQGLDSPYDVDKQEVDFQIAYKDFIDNDVAVGDNFSFLLYDTTFIFSVRSYIHDFMGWTELKVELQGVE